jgi:hypothetical protein
MEYNFDRRKITPLQPAAADFLNGSQCGPGGFKASVQTDVSATGCAPLGIPSLTACPTEHDLNKLESDSLLFGDRSADLCKARPSSLGSASLARK